MEYSINVRKPMTSKWTENKELNPCIVETAGFEPLEVKMQRFLQAGVKAQFREDQFTSHELRDMYLTPNCEVLPSDDLETVAEKLEMQNAIRMKILSEKKVKVEDEGAERSGANESKTSTFESESSSKEKNDNLES